MARSEHKEKFVQAELDWYDNYLRQSLEKALRLNGVGVTDELMQSLMGKAKAASDNSMGVYELSFLTRGRFTDMGAGRGYHKGKRSTAIANQSGRKIANGRKPKRWYAKPAYGTINRLLMRLASNYQEEVINKMKQAEKP